jgi:hypothetical protein
MSGPFLEDLNKLASTTTDVLELVPQPQCQNPKYTKDSTLRKYFFVLWLFKTFSLPLQDSKIFLKLLKFSFMEALSVFLSAILKKLQEEHRWSEVCSQLKNQRQINCMA